MASDIEALRRDVKSLREEIRATAYEKDSTDTDSASYSREAESARELAIREAALGARAHPDFEDASWVGWRALPAVEVRNRVRR